MNGQPEAKYLTIHFTMAGEIVCGFYMDLRNEW